MNTVLRRERLVRLMRRGANLTVDEITRSLGASRRTVLRDIATLRDNGYSIAAQSGRGGGLRMDPESVLVSAQLEADEVIALVLSIATLRAVPWIPFAGRAEAALSKIEGALPRERVRELRRVLQRILVGEPANAQALASMGPVDSSLLGCFERAFTERRALEFDYIDARGRSSSRVVEPHALLVRAPLWYVIAWDIRKDGLRLFRMDRIQRARVLEHQKFDARPLKFVLGVCPDAKQSSR